MGGGRRGDLQVWLPGQDDNGSDGLRSSRILLLPSYGKEKFGILLTATQLLVFVHILPTQHTRISPSLLFIVAVTLKLG